MQKDDIMCKFETSEIPFRPVVERLRKERSTFPHMLNYLIKHPFWFGYSQVSLVANNQTTRCSKFTRVQNTERDYMYTGKISFRMNSCCNCDNIQCCYTFIMNEWIIWIINFNYIPIVHVWLYSWIHALIFMMQLIITSAYVFSSLYPSVVSVNYSCTFLARQCDLYM